MNYTIALRIFANKIQTKMNDLQSHTRYESQSKSHSQLLSSSLHSSIALNYDTLTSYQPSQQQLLITNRLTNQNRNKRIRSISISSHQQSTNMSNIPCFPSSSSYNNKNKEERIDFILNDDTIANNNNLISESEFLIVKYNLLNKLKLMCKQTIIRNLLMDYKIFPTNSNICPTNIANTLVTNIFLNITEFECVTKIQRHLSNLIKKYGKLIIINALNTEILIKYENNTFVGTLTSFLYNKVRECNSLLLIYDWHGGRIPHLLSVNNTNNSLLNMNFIANRKNIQSEWHMPMKTHKNLFLYCLENDIEPFVISNNINKINIRTIKNIESDLLLIYILRYETECWNEIIFECIGNENKSIGIHIINYCYNFIYNKLYKPLTMQMYGNNNKNSNLFRYISNNKSNQNNKSITLCISYSLIRKKETGISAIKKLLNLTLSHEHDKNKSVFILINNVLKYNEILKSRLFSQLIECNDTNLLTLLLSYVVVYHCHYMGIYV